MLENIKNIKLVYTVNCIFKIAKRIENTMNIALKTAKERRKCSRIFSFFFKKNKLHPKPNKVKMKYTDIGILNRSKRREMRRRK